MSHHETWVAFLFFIIWYHKFMKEYVVQLLGWSEESAENLNQNPKKWAVFLIGPPGSGKGTQADLLAERFGLVHIQTSKLGEAKINDSELIKNNPEIAEIKKQYDKGELFPPPWIVKIVLDKAKEIADKGQGIIFSGSPRTIYEAENEMPYFENLYGKENIKTRNEVYHRRTEPIMDFLEKKGYEIIEVNGIDSIQKVFEVILNNLNG